METVRQCCTTTGRHGGIGHGCCGSWDGREQVHGRSEHFLKVFIHAILIFGLETWDMNPYIGWKLGGFHNRVTLRLTD